MGGRGESGEAEQQAFFRDRRPLAMRDQDEEREHGQAGEYVCQERAGQPRQRGGQNQREAHGQQPQRLGLA